MGGDSFQHPLSRDAVVCECVDMEDGSMGPVRLGPLLPHDIVVLSCGLSSVLTFTQAPFLKNLQVSALVLPWWERGSANEPSALRHEPLRVWVAWRGPRGRTR